MFKPHKDQKVFLYTYPQNNLENVPVATEAIVLHCSSSGTTMKISYDEDPNATCVIIGGQWGLQYASFPNYVDFK